MAQSKGIIMPRKLKASSLLAREAVRRFPTTPTMTLAKYLIHTNGEFFQNDIEKARSSIRFFRGEKGNINRKEALASGNLFEAVKSFPPSIANAKTNFILPPGDWLILSDSHVPYHAPIAIDAALDYGIVKGITGILLNGDWQDCAALSYWPQPYRNFHREVELTIDSLDYLHNAFPNAPIIYKPGNHEERLRQYYQSRAAELTGQPTASLEIILSLEARGIEFLERKQKIMAGRLVILHGHELRGGTTVVSPARWLSLKAKASALVAHHHRTSEHDTTTINGKLQTCWSVGCLCDLSPDYSPECNDWNWGFAVLHLEEDGTYEVDNRKILANGKII